MIRAALFAALCLGVLACGDGTVSDCACFIQSGDGTQVQLGCGESRCLGGHRYDCEEDVITSSGMCSLDLAMQQPETDAGCIALRASCRPREDTCCGAVSDDGADGGVLGVICSPETLVCCVATGQKCRTGADCCGDRACIKDVSGGTSRCGV